MDKNTLLSHTELVVMETLWEAERPLTNPEISELAKGTGWKGMKTVNTITRRLLEKGLIHEGAIVKNKGAFAQQYIPSVSAKEYLENQIMGNKIFNQKSNQMIPALFSAMLANQEVDQETISEMENILKEYKKFK